MPWLRTVFINGVAEELHVEQTTEDGAVDLFFGEERWVGWGYEEAPGGRWGVGRSRHFGLEGAGKEMLDRWVKALSGPML